MVSSTEFKNEYGDMMALVVVAPKSIYIGVRGTELVEDLFAEERAFIAVGRFQFLKSYYEEAVQIKTQLIRKNITREYLAGDGKKIFFTGHNKGGCVAFILYALYFSNYEPLATVVTFGSPKFIGISSSSVENFIRYRIKGDGIPDLPVSSLLKHYGNEIIIPRKPELKYMDGNVPGNKLASFGSKIISLGMLGLSILNPNIISLVNLPKTIKGTQDYKRFEFKDKLSNHFMVHYMTSMEVYFQAYHVCGYKSYRTCSTQCNVHTNNVLEGMKNLNEKSTMITLHSMMGNSEASYLIARNYSEPLLKFLADPKYDEENLNKAIENFSGAMQFLAKARLQGNVESSTVFAVMLLSVSQFVEQFQSWEWVLRLCSPVINIFEGPRIALRNFLSIRDSFRVLMQSNVPVEILSQASVLGDSEADLALGLYFQGLSTNPNLLSFNNGFFFKTYNEESFKHWKRGADRGNYKCQILVAYVYGLKGKVDSAKWYLGLAANVGNSFVARYMLLCLEQDGLDEFLSSLQNKTD